MKNLIPNFSAIVSACLKAGAFASATLLFSVPSLSAAVAKPVLDFNFNGSGNTETSTGTNTVTGSFRNFDNQWTNLHSAAGGGVSGLPGDLAFNNTASNQMGGTSSVPGEGGIFFASGAHDALTAFTISGWYKSDTVLGNNARLANGAISIFSDSSSSNRGLTLSLSNVGSATALHTDTGNVYAQVNTWTFFAISFEAGSENNVKFYAGTTAADVSLVATLSIDNPSAVIAASSLNIGNSGSRNRPYDGFLDNFRLWDSVLDLNDLQFVRAADLNNSQIPEASTYALLAGAAAISAVVLLRRRNRG